MAGGLEGKTSSLMPTAGSSKIGGNNLQSNFSPFQSKIGQNNLTSNFIPGAGNQGGWQPAGWNHNTPTPIADVTPGEGLAQ